MFDAARLPEDPTVMYREQGFAVLRAYDPEEAARIDTLALDWLYGLLSPWIGTDRAGHPIADYHQWHAALGIEHGELLRARNRYMRPSPADTEIILNRTVRDFLSDVGAGEFEVWDDGNGWLGFRLIRPGMNDGYPFSRKEWGPAKTVVSMWIPVVGTGPRETLCVVPGSHVREYEHHLPEETKFAKDEFHLTHPPAEDEMYRPELGPGEIIIYHPRIIHTEDVLAAPTTRFNLEARLNPA